MVKEIVVDKTSLSALAAELRGWRKYEIPALERAAESA